MKEAAARIKINMLLEAAGWRFFRDTNGPANIRLEPSVTIKPADLEGLGDNFEKPAIGFVDFLLLDEKGLPLGLHSLRSHLLLHFTVPLSQSSPTNRSSGTRRKRREG